MSGQGKRRALRRKEGEWRALLARYGTSGLGPGGFCEREGISAASFHRWRRRFQGGGARTQPVARHEAPVFIDAGTMGAGLARTARLDLRLDLGEGLVLHLVRS